MPHNLGPHRTLQFMQTRLTQLQTDPAFTLPATQP